MSSRQCEENTLHVPTWVDVSLPVGSKTLLIAHKSRTTATEPLPTAPQKKLVAVLPNAPPDGTVYARGRQWFDHAIGSVHCVFRFGPVGPLKNAG